MAEISIDSNIAIPKIVYGRKMGSGSSEVYRIGKEIYDRLNEGESTFIEDVNEKAIYIRIKRLCKQNLQERAYTVRKEGEGHRIFRVK